ncbi:MBL fold metallo-hydrolase [Congregibacter variabilis]|uniref:MBL fold metallo-hydrolase n=1 Tax=Congregibacter variabilis TaxID=3081200 RepID=A0ABZ0HYQ8_9GAMM|nr:MBL fold metallo-hydrolase [Congregibacter sp. IMCC43200]
MKITHYTYNAFLVEEGNTRIAIDPGQNLWIFALRSLIPKDKWPGVTHIVITHGDPDHHWQSDRVAAASGAYVVCGIGLTKTENSETLVVDPRGRGLTSWIHLRNLHPLDVGESIELAGVTIEAVRSVHGPIAVPLLGFTLRQKPGPDERVGLGSMAFKITIGNKSVLNLGDSLLMTEWEGLRPTVLMLPIGGGGGNTWTMDVDDAIQAVELIDPQLVIPCHYNVPFLWKKKFAVADDARFKREVEALGKKCRILGPGGVANV